MTTDGKKDVQNGNRERVEETGEGQREDGETISYRGHGRKDMDEKDERQRGVATLIGGLCSAVD